VSVLECIFDALDQTIAYRLDHRWQCILCVFVFPRLTTVISPPMDVIASCVNCLTVLAARMPAKVRTLWFSRFEN